MHRIHSTLSHYRILAKLGEGGMGAVYRARDVRLGRQVALKLAPWGSTLDAGARSRFLAEACAIASLEHPHICTLFEFDEVEGQPFMAMQLVEGETLSEALTRGPLSELRVCEVLRAVGSALAVAHANGIIHRDVKSDNVLLGLDGSIKLTDFGIAILEDAARKSSSSSSSVLGTPSSCAPELILGGKATPASDQFALAVLAYEALTGRMPFEGRSTMQLLHAILHEEPAPPTGHRADLSPAWDQVLLRALRRDPGWRFPSVQEFVRAAAGVPVGGESAEGDAGTGRSTAAAELYEKGCQSYALYTHAGNLQALERFERAISASSGYALAWAGVADCCAQMADKGWDTNPVWLDRGLEAAERAVALAPGLARPHKALGSVQLQRGDYEAARAALGRAIEVEPGFVPAHVNLASVCRALGDYAGSERSLRQALAINRAEPYVLWALAYTLTFTRRYDEVLLLAERLKGLGHSTYFQMRAYVIRACAYAYQGSADGARRELDELYARGTEGFGPRAAAALVACAAGDAELAQELVREAEVEMGQSLVFHWLLADAAAWAGDVRATVRILRAAEHSLAGMELAGLRLLPGIARVAETPEFRAWISDRGRTLVWPAEAPPLAATERAAFTSLRTESGLFEVPGEASIPDGTAFVAGSEARSENPSADASGRRPTG